MDFQAHRLRPGSRTLTRQITPRLGRNYRLRRIKRRTYPERSDLETFELGEERTPGLGRDCGAGRTNAVQEYSVDIAASRS